MRLWNLTPGVIIQSEWDFFFAFTNFIRSAKIKVVLGCCVSVRPFFVVLNRMSKSRDLAWTLTQAEVPSSGGSLGKSLAPCGALARLSTWGCTGPCALLTLPSAGRWHTWPVLQLVSH